MLLVLYGLTRVEHSGPVAIDVLGPAGAGAGLLLVFVAWERRAAAPLVRLGILQVKSLRGASLGVGANAAAFTSVVYVGTSISRRRWATARCRPALRCCRSTW
jgi:predicted small integral membrane protein